MPKSTWQVGGAVWQFPLTQLRPRLHSEVRTHGPHRGVVPVPPRVQSQPTMPKTIRSSAAGRVISIRGQDYRDRAPSVVYRLDWIAGQSVGSVLCEYSQIMTPP